MAHLAAEACLGKYKRILDKGLYTSLLKTVFGVQEHLFHFTCVPRICGVFQEYADAVLERGRTMAGARPLADGDLLVDTSPSLQGHCR